MRFFGKEQPRAEAPGECRFERGDLVGADAQMPLGAAGEARELGRLARRREDEASLPHDIGHARRPPVDRAARPHHEPGTRVLGLAEGREHGPGEPRGTGPGDACGALEDLDCRAPLGELGGDREPGDARSDHRDAHAPHSPASRLSASGDM